MYIVCLILKVLSHCGIGKTFPILLQLLVRSCLGKHAKKKEREKCMERAADCQALPDLGRDKPQGKARYAYISLIGFKSVFFEVSQY